jgi:phosphoglucomutase
MEQQTSSLQNIIFQDHIRDLKSTDISTVNFQDQNPGTSGLRKKVKHFMQKHYLENFTQSIFLAHSESDYKGKTLVVGGDGRFYNNIAINIIIKMAAANGVHRILVAENGNMSTPCVSLVVRSTTNCFGAVILSASHNPGGEDEDFGIKFNNASGAPAPENITGKMFASTKELKSYKTLVYDKDFSLKTNTLVEFVDESGNAFKSEIVIESTTKLYVETMQKIFDFEKLRELFARKDFKFCIDAMHGAAGPYAYEIFNKVLGVSEEHLFNCNILPDFGGLHPDPNLVHAKKIVGLLDIDKKKKAEELGSLYDFGAACDGDADRNMILGKQFFVSPSDSIAIITANAHLIPSLSLNVGLIGCARSMPTSGALDRVAKKLGIRVII